MPRKPSPKIIRSAPPITCLGPAKAESLDSSLIILDMEEWEALRLVDYAGMDQQTAARSMGISRQSVQTLLASGRAKLARMVVEGLTLKIADTNIVAIKPNIQKSERKHIMKIAVTAQHTEVFPHFGRTPEFYIVEAEDGKIVSEKIIAAPAEGHGALVEFLVEQGVDTIICGGIGGGAVNGLRANNIQIFSGASGPVKQQVLSLLAGLLPQTGDANCDHHNENCHEHQHGQKHGGGHGHGHGEHKCSHNE